MPVFRLPNEHVFPPPHMADPSGIIAVGGDLHPDRVLLAYTSGIFPWYSDGQPLLWWSPDPRMVLRPAELKVQRSLKKRITRGDYRITFDTAFSDVLDECAETPRPDQDGTWLTKPLRAAFVDLHRRGIAHSVEAWHENTLVGGLYGLAIGGVFCGESMFARRSDASKVAFVHLVRQLQRWNFSLVDCQVHTPHLERFGAYETPRDVFLDEFHRLAAMPGRPGPWQFDPEFDARVPVS
ncbi:MAG: leucyl/phenylalanyl-tRNA--protein transferase [Myxococcota bacterium]|jgi:leucyl/phenylalanyl-tRNA--protein transferase